MKSGHLERFFAEQEELMNLCQEYTENFRTPFEGEDTMFSISRAESDTRSNLKLCGERSDKPAFETHQQIPLSSGIEPSVSGKLSPTDGREENYDAIFLHPPDGHIESNSSLICGKTIDTKLEDSEVSAVSPSSLNSSITFPGDGIGENPKMGGAQHGGASQARPNTATTSAASSSRPTAPLLPARPLELEVPAASNVVSGNKNGAGLTKIAESSRSGHRNVSLRDKVLKKSVQQIATREDLVGNTSNVTTPSNTPSTSAAPQLSSAKPPPANAKSAREARKAEKARKEQELKKRKEEEMAERRMTPSEYAVRVHAKFASAIQNTKRKQFLKGKRIFFITGDHHEVTKLSRKKMDLIVQHGGTLLAKFDMDLTTHVITTTDSKSYALKALGLKSFEDLPEHIPTLNWTWITTGFSGRLDHEFMHAVFGRVDADSSKAAAYFEAKKKATVENHAQDRSSDDSLIEDFSIVAKKRRTSCDIPSVLPSAPPPLPLEKRASSSRSTGGERKTPHDPLAEFYAKAKDDLEASWPDYEGSEDEDVEVEIVLPKRTKAGFTCDQKGVKLGDCPNQDVIDKLKELAGIHETKPTADDKWRVYSYNKVCRILRNYPKRIQSISEARKLKGVGDKTASKIMEIINTGSLKRINYERTEDVEAAGIFMGIYGVGPNIARGWYMNGCRTLEDVKQRKGGITVTDVQEIGIKFYDDINKRMPREECGAIFAKIKPIALAIDPKLFVEIMGSYRRGKADCGDIDILITRPTDDGKDHKGVLKKLLQELHIRGILTEDLAIPDDFNDLEQTYRGLCRLDSSKPRRRIDFLCVPYKSRGAALLYYTGDDIFNRAIRYKAGAMGFSLNQRGLYSGVIRATGDRTRKLNKGNIIASETEEEIFRILGVPWQEPYERVRS